LGRAEFAAQMKDVYKILVEIPHGSSRNKIILIYLKETGYVIESLIMHM
jgi:hypothetical protein